jgi:hypothetical protein
MLGPKTVKVLEEVSAKIKETYYWVAYSKCGTPRLVIWGDDEGGGLMARMMKNHWDLQCCGGACYGHGHHFCDKLTGPEIQKMGFPALTL